MAKGGYDKEKDKIIKNFRIPISSERELNISIQSYDGGENKVQLGPYIRIDRDGHDIGIWGKLGRMDLSEIEMIFEKLPTVIKALKKLNK